METIILHHYPPSPVAEKIRTAFGLKRLTWHSVEHNRLPDRPELFAMTGGYRRIPVMQVGADIYCDTQLILRELERRAPTPTLHPGGSEGIDIGLSRWVDSTLFELTVRTAVVPDTGKMPAEVRQDRAQLYFGPDFDLDVAAADMPHTLAQLRAQFGWFNTALDDGGDFLAGAAPGMRDLSAWYVVWFFRARFAEAESLLAEFPALLAWAVRMQDIGHGVFSDITPTQALEIARQSESQTPQHADDNDPQGLVPGQQVSVAPMHSPGDEPAVRGLVRWVDMNRIAIEREHDSCGSVVVHFPRVGYRVTRL